MSDGYFTCPNCGNQMTESVDTCPNCTYDFGQLISCSYKNDSGDCLLTQNPCHVKGLNYEDCQIYINKFNLGINPD